MQYEEEIQEDEREEGGVKRWLGYSLAGLLALGAFVSGMQFGQVSVTGASQPAGLFGSFFSTPTETVQNAEPDLTEFWRVWELLDEKFVTASTTLNITDEMRIQGAIDGMVSAFGDPYTVYLPPVDAEAFDETISGNFSGVGMEVGIREELVTIIAPLPNTPAERAGLIAGDVIVRINETSTEGMRIDEAVNLIRGERGTTVELTIYREGEDEFLTITVTRDTIEIPTVKTEKVDDTFIIALYSFNAVSEAKMADAMREYQESGAKKLVLDLRGNPGGFLQSAVSIAGHFLPSGKVVVIEQSGADAPEEVFRSRGRQVQEFTPRNLVVLVDNGSASASEILAGALKDHGVATVIGIPTFGKGSVQELLKLDDGSSLKVTVARWLTPNKVSISDGGLQPDIHIRRTPDDRVAEVDPQKNAALRFLDGETVESEAFEEQVIEGGAE